MYLYLNKYIYIYVHIVYILGHKNVSSSISGEEQTPKVFNHPWASELEQLSSS